MFSDEAKIHIKAGNGGNGRVGFLHEKYREFGGPDGGDGGKGGDIIFRVKQDLNTLYFFQTHKLLRAENGEEGGQRKKRGKMGEDLIINVPKGTIVSDLSGEILADLNNEDSEAVIATGGKGGFGNAHFTTSVRQAPKIAELGEKGEEMDIKLELKLIADVGLVGLPNAGKSMLLSVITKARPKVADYPFTTIIPNLGVVEGNKFGLGDGQGFVVCDIPGLIEDASKGKGLGDQFLRHVERTKVLVHLIDATSEDITGDFDTIVKELEDYKKEVYEKPQIIVLTKSDLPDEKDLISKEKKLKNHIGKLKKINIVSKEPFVISSVTGDGLKELITGIYKAIKEIPEPKKATEEAYKVFTIKDVKTGKGFFVEEKDGIFLITGEKIEKFASRTDFSNKEAVYRLKDIIKRMGIEKELLKKGATNGSKILIGGQEMSL